MKSTLNLELEYKMYNIKDVPLRITKMIITCNPHIPIFVNIVEVVSDVNFIGSVIQRFSELGLHGLTMTKILNFTFHEIFETFRIQIVDLR